MFKNAILKFGETILSFLMMVVMIVLFVPVVFVYAALMVPFVIICAVLALPVSIVRGEDLEVSLKRMCSIYPSKIVKPKDDDSENKEDDKNL